jgi:hypothetical protein
MWVVTYIQQRQLKITFQYTDLSLHQYVWTAIIQCIVLYKQRTFRPDLTAALNFLLHFSNHIVVWVSVRLLSSQGARKLDGSENVHPSQHPATAVVLIIAIKKRPISALFHDIHLGVLWYGFVRGYCSTMSP